ncbi:hypothetical protein C8J57DRAFT_1235104 [Mycena rebaudengoi]|nr:hypothetical protein C8J57DRAFT_1235104 [Mycena rebaudengoi]
MGQHIQIWVADIARCSMMERVLEGLMFLQESLVDTTLGLRVPAMYGFDLRVLVPMSIILAISVALGLFGEPGMLTAPALNLTGCETALLRATAFRQARSWEGQLVFDTVIFGLTAYRAYTDHNVMKLVDGSLIKRMMKDVRRCVFPVLYLKDQLATENYNSNYRLSPQLSVALIARLGLNLKRAGAPPPTCTEDPDSTTLDVIRFKDPRPPQPLEEATFDDEDFELVAERENARIREYLPDSAAELVNQTNREGDRAQIHALDFWWDMALAAPRFASSMA